MRNRLLALVTIWLVAVASACTAAVKAPPRHPTGGPPPNAAATISRQLGLSKQQTTQLNALMTKTMTESRKIMDSKIPETQKRTRMEALHKQSEAKFVAMLTPTQRKKLEEMKRAAPRSGGMPGRQMGPHRSFADAVGSALSGLKLSKTQSTKTTAILKDFEKRHQALRSSKLPQDQRRQKANALKKDTMGRIMAVLTPAQQKQFKEKVWGGIGGPGGPKPRSGAPAAAKKGH